MNQMYSFNASKRNLFFIIKRLIVSEIVYVERWHGNDEVTTILRHFFFTKQKLKTIITGKKNKHGYL